MHDLIQLGETVRVSLPRDVEAPRLLTLEAFCSAQDSGLWVARVRRGGPVLAEFGPLAEWRPLAAGAAEVRAILGLSSPNLERVAGLSDLPFQDLKMGRIWAEQDVHRLAAERTKRRTNGK